MTMNLKASKRDLLQQKRSELDTYKSTFDSAVSVITSTIQTLSTINDGIDSKIQEIEDYQNELLHVKEELGATKSRNSGIVRNLSALMEA